MTLESQYKEFLRLNPRADLSFEEWEKINSRLVKQALINMMKADEELGLYNEPKQETLEEVAERLYPIYDRFKYDEDWVEDVTKRREDFIKGAKWQQERSYSEEEVLNKLTHFAVEIQRQNKQGIVPLRIKEWFDRNKKK